MTTYTLTLDGRRPALLTWWAAKHGMAEADALTSLVGGKLDAHAAEYDRETDGVLLKKIKSAPKDLRDLVDAVEVPAEEPVAEEPVAKL